MHRAIVTIILGLGLLAGPARADPSSRVVFTHKHWTVSVVSFDDGTLSCAAEVAEANDNFTLWGHRDGTVQMQFYSAGWDLDGAAIDIQVEIDRRGAWNLRGAETFKQSILFVIEDSREGVRFLGEVMRGNVLYLRTAAGRGVQSYSLSGSSASIRKLVDCMDYLQTNSAPSANPFK
jgi:hypothetical protein